MTNRSPQYIHGTDADEQRRLTMMNSIINEPALREMKLQPGQRVLDVGSGLAQFTRMMAREVGDEGCVVGIEFDEQQIEEAIRQARAAEEDGLVQLRQGDARNLPLLDDEWGSFDIVHCRFVLEHIPDPLIAVKQMVKAARSGGRIVLQDDDHDVLRMWPACDEGVALWRGYIDSYAPTGNDPFIGRKLITLLHQAGATPTRNTWLFYGACFGHEAFDALVGNLLGVLAGARDTIKATSSLTDSDIDAGLDAIRAWQQLPDAALWYAICWAEGVRQ